ncbi:hypothetical protein OG512_38980 [Streptomyces sp. NBC_01378]|uniref:hypothetical protein n=1 Tax=Streptomyces sp. NBC_01378 TaxID=2903844 RepID=UPI0032453B85
MESNAVNDSGLTEDDYASVLTAVQSLAGKYGAVWTLNEALSGWRLVVIGIEDGFDTSWIWEYHDEFVCRDWLHEAWALLTPRVQQLRLPTLNEWDLRFIAATLPMRTTSAAPSTTEGRWWHNRYPRRVAGEPGEDLPSQWSPEPINIEGDQTPAVQQRSTATTATDDGQGCLSKTAGRPV